ncbi:hypothetical protein ABCR94_13725 [Streptomyces sp. 21So2-11]|uniref:hypothetical protein n=1 Tax=Streptomyces sp. 21So2-11 TaxID=3144408 RepID=UPI00321AC140
MSVADLLFPGADVEVVQLVLTKGEVLVAARARGRTAACPECGLRSFRVHCYYQRHLADRPVAGRRLEVRLHFRPPGGLILELHIDVRWLLDRQERVLGKDLAVHDYSVLVAAVARHRVNTPRLDVGEPDLYWRAAALLDTIVLQRPLPARNELYGYAVAVAYIEASGASATAPPQEQ